jgi:SAM-dependent methyltransferase
MDVGRRVRSFYERSPFPTYAPGETAATLAEKSRRGQAASLDAAIPAGARVLDAGCGTGQLACFLSMARRTVVGVDFSRASLALGAAFAAKEGLATSFLQADLFQAPLRRGAFDVVLTAGVLHHTADPAGGLRTLADLLRPGGHLVAGLYHPLGRTATRARRLLGLGDKDPVAADRSGARRDAWIADQYAHPHETTHSVGEVLTWLDAAGLDFVRTIPSLEGDATGSPFRADPPPFVVRRWLAEATWLVRLAREGGYYLVVGRRRPFVR